MLLFTSFIQFTYFNAILINQNETEVEEGDEDPEEILRRPFHMEEDEHFNNIKVNTTVSTVQVPTNVYNLCKLLERHKVLGTYLLHFHLDTMFTLINGRDIFQKWAIIRVL